MSDWVSPVLGRMYAEAERLRADLAQPPESGVDDAVRKLLDAIEKADVEMGIPS